MIEDIAMRIIIAISSKHDTVKLDQYEFEYTGVNNIRNPLQFRAILEQVFNSYCAEHPLKSILNDDGVVTVNNMIGLIPGVYWESAGLKPVRLVEYTHLVEYPQDEVFFSPEIA